MLAAGVQWLDDWFCHREIVSGIHAIGEVRFHQVNWNYLIIGQTRALMFDSGTGVRDIRPIIQRFTSLPVTCLPSHLHFDHVGNLHLFDDVAIADLPLIRKFEQGGVLQHPGDRFIGEKEGMSWKPARVSHWWPPGHRIDLGGRSLEIVHTPGHAPEHISLWERETSTFLAADFVYHGALYAQIAGADLDVYRDTAERLLQLLPGNTHLFGAHGIANEAGLHNAPALQVADLKELLTVLKSIKKMPTKMERVEVNSLMYLLIGGLGD
jgi:hydroxyacylglutathione hydrolase